jgi:hypothetical protein
MSKPSSLLGLVISDEGKKFYNFYTSGLYYKPFKIVNDDSRVINKLVTSLTDNARVVIYNRHMFIVQATGYFSATLATKKKSFVRLRPGGD